MDNSSEITVLIYYNRSIIQNTYEGAIFMSSEQAYFFISQIIWFEELNAGLCESINVDTEKRVVRIRYRCPISIVNGNIKYRAVRISSDKDVQVMFRTYWWYTKHISPLSCMLTLRKLLLLKLGLVHIWLSNITIKLFPVHIW